jgi:hypothetical protein
VLRSVCNHTAIGLLGDAGTRVADSESTTSLQTHVVRMPFHCAQIICPILESECLTSGMETCPGRKTAAVHPDANARLFPCGHHGCFASLNRKGRDLTTTTRQSSREQIAQYDTGALALTYPNCLGNESIYSFEAATKLSHHLGASIAALKFVMTV